MHVIAPLLFSLFRLCLQCRHLLLPLLPSNLEDVRQVQRALCKTCIADNAFWLQTLLSLSLFLVSNPFRIVYTLQGTLRGDYLTDLSRRPCVFVLLLCTDVLFDFPPIHLMAHHLLLQVPFKLNNDFLLHFCLLSRAKLGPCLAAMQCLQLSTLRCPNALSSLCRASSIPCFAKSYFRLMTVFGWSETVDLRGVSGLKGSRGIGDFRGRESVRK